MRRTRVLLFSVLILGVVTAPASAQSAGLVKPRPQRTQPHDPATTPVPLVPDTAPAGAPRVPSSGPRPPRPQYDPATAPVPPVPDTATAGMPRAGRPRPPRTQPYDAATAPAPPVPATAPIGAPRVGGPVVPVPVLQLQYSPATFTATIDYMPGYFGAVLLSLSDDLSHYLVGLPPLLSGATVLGFAVSQNGRIEIVVPRPAGPAIPVYGQALVYDGGCWFTSAVAGAGGQ